MDRGGDGCEEPEKVGPEAGVRQVCNIHTGRPAVKPATSCVL